MSENSEYYVSFLARLFIYWKFKIKKNLDF